MLSLFEAVLLGIVEGFTEFLPVSSTGHLVLASSLLGIPQESFVKTFEISIQLGAILSVVVLYWRSFLLKPEVIKRLAVAFAPTAVIGFTLYKQIKHLLESNGVILTALAVGGLVLIIFERAHKAADAQMDIMRLSYGRSLVIGLFQSIAMIPGVSRSAATIVGGLLAGLPRTAAVEFSFLLAVPTMFAATGLDLFENAGQFSADQFGVLAAGFLVSFVTALLSIRFLLKYVQRHDFTAFGAYRIVIAAVLAMILL